MSLTEKTASCLFCWKSCSSEWSNANTQEAENIELVTKIFKSCSRHLTSDVLGNSSRWLWTNFRNNSGPFCSPCFSSAKQLTAKNDLLESVETEIKTFVTNLTSQILFQRLPIGKTKTVPDISTTQVKVNKSRRSNAAEQYPVLLDISDNDDFDSDSIREKSSKFCSDVEKSKLNALPKGVANTKSKLELMKAATSVECKVNLTHFNFEGHTKPKTPTPTQIKIKTNRKKTAPHANEQKKVLAAHKEGKIRDKRTDIVIGHHCVKCGVYVREKRHIHNDLCHKEYYKCDDCGKFFGSQLKLDLHIKSKPTPLNEDIQNKQSADDERPQRKQDPSDKCLQSKQESPIEGPQSKQDPYEHKCPTCGSGFLDRNDLKQHQEKWKHNKTEKVKCQQFQTQGDHQEMRSWEEPKKTATPKRICEECGKSFRCPSHLKYHKILKHSTERPYECEMCGKRFKLKHMMTAHSRIHSAETVSRCKECDKTFTTNFYLRRHIRLFHSSNNYPCEICDYVTLFKSSLKTHMFRLHDPNKRFACDGCGIRLSTQGSLTNHQRIHTGEKPYACTESECGEKFRTSGLLKRHVNLTHLGGFKCDSCDFVTGEKFLLLQHKVTHNEERSFCCEACGKMFKHKSYLRAHSKVCKHKLNSKKRKRAKIIHMRKKPAENINSTTTKISETSESVPK